MTEVGLNVVLLVGPPGSGKTSVGKELSSLLSWQFIDLDQRIEKHLGISVQELFAQRGEFGFRLVETESLAQLIEEKIENTVVATGGGIVTREANFELMRQMGTIVCLQAEVSTLAERLSGDLTRPLLKANDDSQSLTDKLDKLVSDRKHFYAVPDIVVETDGLTPQEVAQAIAVRLTLVTP